MSRPVSYPALAALALFCTCLAAPAQDAPPPRPAAEHPYLADVTLNRRWHAPTDSLEAVFLGDRGGSDPQVVLRKSAFAAGDVKVHIQSDANACVLSAGGADIRLDLPRRGAAVLTLGSDPARPTIQFNRREVAADKATWVGMVLNERVSNVTLTFAEGTFANLRFEPEQRRDSRTTAPAGDRLGLGTRRGRGVVVDPLPAAEAEAMLRQVRRGLFELRATAEGTGAARVGVGFLLDAQGLAVVSYHLVRGATAAAARFDGVEGEAKAEVWSVRPELDLALVKLDLRGLTRGRPEPIALEPEPPAAGHEAWAPAPGAPADNTAAGAVTALRTYSQLTGRIARSAGFPAGSQWIQTSAPITSASAGGPLVNRHGRATGVQSWAWGATGDAALALHVRHVHEMLESKPARPLTFAGLAAEPRRDAPRRTFPRLDVARTGRPEELRAAAANLRASHQCALCNGSGRGRERVVIGRMMNGAPVHGTQEIACPSCDGSGLNDPAVIARVAARVAQALAALRPAPPGTPQERSRAEALRAATETLTEVFAPHGQHLASALAREAERLAAEDEPTPGTPIVFSAGVGHTRFPGATDRLRALATDGGRAVVLAEPDLDATGDARRVIVGGLFAGLIDDGQGRRVPVIQHGFVIGVPERPALVGQSRADP